MKFLDREISAVIFDMDGTLIDSTGLWHEIDKKFFAKRGLELPSDYAQHIVHLGLPQAAKYTKETYNLDDSVEDILNEWHEMSLDMYKNVVQLKEGVLDVLKIFKKNGVRMAIATANDESLYMPCIERLNIGEYFDFIADVTKAKEGKNSAKIYLDVAGMLNTKPENTLVFEDMVTCIKTAHKGGFVTVAVYDKSSKDYDEEKRCHSDLFINSFKDIIGLLE